MAKVNKSEVMKLANRLFEEGLAYDKSHALKLAYQGRDKSRSFGFVNGRFLVEPLI